MTMTESEAFEAMLAHHASLTQEVTSGAELIRAAVEEDVPYAPAVAELVAFLAAEVLPHAVAEERTIYEQASTITELSPAIVAMTAEHARLVALSKDLESAETGDAALRTATSIETLFSDHVVKENELVLPVLRDHGVSLSELLVKMQHEIEECSGSGDRSAGKAASSP